jgi:hypothetical protein
VNIFLKQRFAKDVHRFAEKTALFCDAERQLPEGTSGASRPEPAGGFN